MDEERKKGSYYRDSGGLTKSKQPSVKKCAEGTIKEEKSRDVSTI